MLLVNWDNTALKDDICGQITNKVAYEPHVPAILVCGCMSINNPCDDLYAPICEQEPTSQCRESLVLQATDDTAFPCFSDNLSRFFVDYVSVSRKDFFMHAVELKCLRFTKEWTLCCSR